MTFCKMTAGLPELVLEIGDRLGLTVVEGTSVVEAFGGSIGRCDKTCRRDNGGREAHDQRTSDTR